MPNSYYNNTDPPENALKAKAIEEVVDRAALKAAFDKIPSEADLKLSLIHI